MDKKEKAGVAILTTDKIEFTKGPTSRNIIIKMAKFQDKERILKAAWEKQEVTYK